MVQPIFMIKPSVNKVCIINMLKVAAAVIVIIAVVTYSGQIIDFAGIGAAFEITSEDLPQTGEVIMNFALATILASILTYILSYLSASKKQYLFFQDRFEAYKNFMIFNLTHDQIPLANIVSVRADMSGEKSIMGVGKIIFQLSGMKDPTYEIEDIDAPENYIPYIQNLLTTLRAKQAYEYQVNQKINNTLSGL